MKKLLLVLLALPLIGFGQCISGNCKNGQGTCLWDGGYKYVGEWKDGTRTGQGTATFANGDKYVGEWKYGKRSGQGTYTWANGDKYVGEFKDGKSTYADGTVKQGLWENGEFLGE
jgi:hypothetical protein